MKNLPLFSLFALLFFQLISVNGQTVTAHAVRSNNDAKALYQEGWSLIQQKKYSEAAKVFENLVEIDPKYKDAYTNLSHMYLELGRYEDAANAARKEIANYPGSAMAYNNLGFALTQLGKYDQAIPELKRAISLNVSNTKAHVNLRPESTSTIFVLATSYLDSGNREAAIAKYNVLKKLDPVSAEKLFERINR